MNKSIIIVTFLLLLLSNVNGQNIEDSFLDTTAFTVNLDEYTVTAQYKPTHYTQALNRVDIINRETLLARGVTNLDDALLTSASIRIEQDALLGTGVKMRGLSGNNVAILIDGVPVIGRLGGNVDVSQIPVNSIQRIEIVKGPLSNFYGNNAAGGVINIITIQNQLNAFSAQVNGQIESIGTKSASINMAQNIGKFNVRAKGRYFNYSKYSTDSLRLVKEVENSDGTTRIVTKYPWNPKVQFGYGMSASYRINEENKLIASASFNHEEIFDFGAIRRPQFRPYSFDTETNTDRMDFSLNYDGLLWNRNYIDLTIARNIYHRSAADKRYEFEDEEYDELMTVIDTTNYKSVFSRLNLSRAITDRSNLSVGFHYNREDASGDRIIDRTQEDSTMTFAVEKAFYADYKYNITDRLQMAGSGRFINHSVYKNYFTPSLQMKFDWTKNLILRASAARAYRNPSLKELHLEFNDINHNLSGNIDLKPEKTIDFQLGATWQKESKYRIGLNLYKTAIKDKIELAEIQNLEFVYENIEEYEVFGVEGEFYYNIWGINWTSSANLGYWSTGFDDESVENYTQQFDMNNALNYTIKALEIGLNINHRLVGSEPIFRITEENEVIAQEYSPINYFDLSCNKSFGKRLQVKVTGGIKNILDIQDSELVNINSGNHTTNFSRVISQGRNYFVSLNVQI